MSIWQESMKAIQTRQRMHWHAVPTSGGYTKLWRQLLLTNEVLTRHQPCKMRTPYRSQGTIRYVCFAPSTVPHEALEVGLCINLERSGHLICMWLRGIAKRSGRLLILGDGSCYVYYGIVRVLRNGQISAISHLLQRWH